MTASSTATPPQRRLTSLYKRQLRTAAEAKIQELIAIIDEIDGDPDLEPELAQSGPDQTQAWQLPAIEGDALDTHEGDDNEDREPSLGSLGSYGNDQRNWSGGDACDLEEQCEGEGDDGGGDFDAWYVNPDSVRQEGMCWVRGVSNPERHVRLDDAEAA